MTVVCSDLVAVGAGHGDEVLDAAGDRPPQRVDQAEDGVTVLHVLGDDADGEKVIDLVEGDFWNAAASGRWSRGA